MAMTDAMYPHTATVWHKGPEVDKRATWTRESIEACHWESIRGARRTVSGDASQDSVLLLIPYEGLLLAEHDRIAFGSHTDITPVSGAFEVVCVEPVYLGSFHHWEVTGA